MTDTVRVVNVPGDAPTFLPDGSLLTAFTYPLPASEFKTCDFGKRCVHFRNGGMKRIQHLLQANLYDGDVEALCRSTPSEQLHCWLRITEEGKERIESVKVDDAKYALTLHKAGASLYFRAPAGFAAVYVPALSECLDMSFASYYDAAQRQPRGEVEVFVSKKGHVTRWHWDFMENFTIQLSGTKRWRIKRSNVPNPARGATPHYTVDSDVVEQQVKVNCHAASNFRFNPDASFFDDCQEVELRAGDTFYFPPGMWHEVSASSDSLSINLSLVTETWADLSSSAIKHALLGSASWRSAISLPLTGTPAPVSGQKRKRGASEQTTSLHTRDLLSDYESIRGMLSHLREFVCELRPEHFIVPAMLVSQRFSGVPGSEHPRETAAATPNPVDFSSSARTYGYDIWLHEGQLVVTVLPKERQPVQVLDATYAWSPNPFAAVHSSESVGLEGEEDPLLLEDGSGSFVNEVERESTSSESTSLEKGIVGLVRPPRPVGYNSCVVHVNFGNEDFSSQSRVVVQYPAALQWLFEHVLLLVPRMLSSPSTKPYLDVRSIARWASEQEATPPVTKRARGSKIPGGISQINSSATAFMYALEFAGCIVPRA